MCLNTARKLYLCTKGEARKHLQNRPEDFSSRKYQIVMFFFMFIPFPSKGQNYVYQLWLYFADSSIESTFWRLKVFFNCSVKITLRYVQRLDNKMQSDLPKKPHFFQL